MYNFEFTLVHNLLGSDFELGKGGTVLPSAETKARTALPAVIPAGASMKIVLLLYDDQVKSLLHDMMGASGTLSALPVGSPATATVLATGSISPYAVADGKMVFTVAAGVIQDSWAAYDAVRFWFELGGEAGAVEITLFQDVKIKSMSQVESVEYPDAGDIEVPIHDASADYTVVAAPGLQIIRVDTTAVPVTVTMHAAADPNAGEVIIIHDSGANAAYVKVLNGDTINGFDAYAAPVELGGVGRGVDLIPNSAGAGFTNIQHDVDIG